MVLLDKYDQLMYMYIKIQSKSAVTRIIQLSPTVRVKYHHHKKNMVFTP